MKKTSIPLKSVPLYEKLRPKTIQEVVGQRHLLSSGGFLSKVIENAEYFSLILWGPPGVGKTTIAKLLAEVYKGEFVSISAMFTTISELKEVFVDAKRKLEDYNKQTILFIDEIHRLNIKQQDVFLPVLEDGTIILIGATTENPSFYLNKALLSRCQVLELEALTFNNFKELLERVENFLNIKFKFSEEVLKYLITISNGDGRYFITILETISMLAPCDELSIENVKNFIQKRASVYDKNKDEHYNIISALHKSIRGSDEQASLYWFYRMVDGGEDINYIARRLLRVASEDIGLADPNALNIAISAWNTFERLGEPEGILALAELVVYLALAPKSNAIYIASKKAIEFAKKTSNVKPPKHILNAPTKVMKDLGYGSGYKYDHDEEDGFSGQSYFPDGMKRQIFYEPKNLGLEREYLKRINYFNNLRIKKNTKPL